MGGTATVAGKTISQAQLQIIRQATLKQQLRLQAAAGITAQAVKTTTIAGQTAVQVQFTQAQPRTQVNVSFFDVECCDPRLRKLISLEISDF